jgi:hypothetical protein
MTFDPDLFNEQFNLLLSEIDSELILKFWGISTTYYDLRELAGKYIREPHKKEFGR